MITLKQIIVTYDKGLMVLETFGMKGPACKNDSKFLEDALGLQNGDEIRKAEWYLENEDNLKFEATMGVDGTKLCG